MKRGSKKRKTWVTLESNISIDKFNELVRPLIGLPVSRPWRGYGSALCLELGKRTHKGYPSGRAKGVAGVMIEWSWRAESAKAIRFGSFNMNAKMNHEIARLRGRIENISLFSRLPEILIQLSGGSWISSYMTANGQPQWAIFLPDKSWLVVRRGRVVRERGSTKPKNAKTNRH